MPLRKDIKSVLIIGSGPIIIGQAAEFDYSGTQAARALKEVGIKVILANSNPATIMTDQEIADEVYLEPLNLKSLKKIVALERPDGVIASMGGQTGLNLGLELESFLKQEGIELLGVNAESIFKAEDREAFKETMRELGIELCPSRVCRTLDEAIEFYEEINSDVIIRPAFTLGGTGGGHARSRDELIEIMKSGLKASPVSQCLVEMSIAGHKEIEYEVLRDQYNNACIVCNMENFDPVGVHTGDSIVVAPSQTLTDRDYQRMRTVSLDIVKALKIVGACNVQLALDPKSDAFYIIEVNPRVSRSSALASKATGIPIAKFSALMALGLGLHEIQNPITKQTMAMFEPALDYIVTKIPRWPFDKFFQADRRLGTQMKATGEVMAIGISFEESLLKALRSLEIKNFYLLRHSSLSDQELFELISRPTDERLWHITDLISRGIEIQTIHHLTKIDLWFLNKLENLVKHCLEFKDLGKNINSDIVTTMKLFGFSDKELKHLNPNYESSLRKNVHYSFQHVDTCAGEFQSSTPYYFGGWRENQFYKTSKKDKHKQKTYIVLGSGPIRIGQGVEFDYATVHALWALKEMGHRAIVINNNPETVSTDFDVADALYFEPLTSEEVKAIYDQEKADGVIVQFGGQTAINLTEELEKLGLHIVGTSHAITQGAEDRRHFESILDQLQLARPLGRAVNSLKEAQEKVHEIGFPLMLRPSYVIGGQAMEVVEDKDELIDYFHKNHQEGLEILMDRYLIGIEAEVDAISDGEDVFVCAIMEHIERAGIHSGDSYACYPPHTLSLSVQKDIIKQTKQVIKGLKLKGPVNLQFVIKKNEVFILEVNPRSSRTLPFLAKMTGLPLAKIATKVIMGKKLKELGLFDGIHPEPSYFSVKAPVFSFQKLSSLDTALGPEMKSTGEAIGIGEDFTTALSKAFFACGIKLPSAPRVLITVADKHKSECIDLCQRLYRLGASFVATSGTQAFLKEYKIPARVVHKIGDSDYDLLDELRDDKVDLIINTITKGKSTTSDGYQMRRLACEKNILCLTSIDTAYATLKCLERLHMRPFSLNHLKEQTS